MNFKEYVENAIRTESGFSVLLPDTVSPLLNDRLLHAAIGMQTEVGEMFEALFIKGKNGKVDLVNIKEELGDLLWYFAILCDNLNYFDFEFDEKHRIEFESVYDYVYEINNLTISILDSVKKSLFYRKELCIKSLKENLAKLFDLTKSLIVSLGGDIERIAITNIEKLKARYPQKFTSKNAIERNLEAERKVLEASE